MQKLIAGLLLSLGLASPALAQTKFTMPPPAGVTVGGLQVVTTCGTASGLVAGNTAFAAMDTTGALCTNASGGGGGGLSVVDQASWTQGTSPFTPNGGVFNDTATLSTGQQGTQRYTTKRAGIVDVDTSGNALYSAITAPVPYLIATTCTTNTYTNGQTQPGNANLNGNACVFIGNTSIAVTIAGNQAVNLAQVNGVTVLTGAGATGTGAQRETVAQDTTTIAGSAPGTAGTPSTNVVSVQGVASGTVIPANTAQVNGVTTLTGTGATGTGAQRVTVATDQTTNAGAALVKGGVGVVNGGSTYQAVAASQTATVLQTSTGAIGDYLSHCTIYPTSTSPGVVTVFDNTNAAGSSAILFPGGATSISNLVPFAIPVGAVSTAGAWKVTTGANVSVVCYGKFS